MNGPPASVSPRRGREFAVVAARWLLGAVFLYMGLNKAMHPVDFLKVLRQYEMVEGHMALNLIAAALPWFEIFCGLLLLGGIAVRGAALTALLMLVPFTLIVLNRAAAIHAANAIPFCAIRFDCGCGAGEVVICYKLLENIGLIFLSTLVLAVRGNRWCLRHNWVSS